MATLETEVSRSADVENAVVGAAWHRELYNESTSTFLGQTDLLIFLV